MASLCLHPNNSGFIIRRKDTNKTTVSIEMHDTAPIGTGMYAGPLISSSYRSYGYSSSNKIRYLYEGNDMLHIFYKDNITGEDNRVLLNSQNSTYSNSNNTIWWPSTGNIQLHLPGLGLFKNINSGATYNNVKSYFDENGSDYNVYFWMATDAIMSAAEDLELVDFNSYLGWEYEEEGDWLTWGPGWWEYMPGTLAWGHYNMLRCDSANIVINGTFPCSKNNINRDVPYVRIGFCLPKLFNRLSGMNASGYWGNHFTLNLNHPTSEVEYYVKDVDYTNIGGVQSASYIGWESEEDVLYDSMITTIGFSPEAQSDFLGTSINKSITYSY